MRGVSNFEMRIAGGGQGRPWDVLMRDARSKARWRDERTRVTGVRDRFGRWLYVVECSTQCPCRSGDSHGD
jgi:hypothetical protein